MKKPIILKITFYIIFILFQNFFYAPVFGQKDHVIIGYVGGFRGVVDTEKISANKLTHINYAFVDVKDSLAVLTNISTDTINFRKLNLLKQDNPDLKIMISLGGWTWSKNFSDAVLTPTSRKLFAASSVDILRKYDLDGVDIDWEYPGMKGDNNVFRTEDKQNYTLMFQALREELDQLQKETGRYYPLTTAVGGFSAFLEHSEMDKAQQYLDYVNIMTYDFYTAGKIAGHHTNLFPSEDYENERSSHKAVNEFIEAGVPAEKIVLGIAFYGRSWKMKYSDNHGINREVLEVKRGGGYTEIKDSIMNLPGYQRYWDENAKAPYLFNKNENILISYDDEESVRHKCLYVKEKNLGGVMFWEYFRDPKEYLLDTINEILETE